MYISSDCMNCYLAGCNCGLRTVVKQWYYTIFQVSLLLLLNNYQYNCNNTISSVSVYKWHENYKENCQ